MAEVQPGKSFLEISKNGLSNGVKLTNAVYKVLEFFPESDPLKNRAKDKALAIMDHLTLINEGPGGCPGWASFHDPKGTPKVKTQLSEDIDILLGYIWIGKSQGWLNSVNCLIIAHEYEKIKKEIEPIIAPIIELTQRLPGIDKTPVLQESTQTRPDGHIDPVLNNGESREGATTEIETNNPESGSVSDKVGTSARQGKILEFLSKNEKAQVMDLQTILPDITKRTIRRDLDELLGAGKIIRSGDFNQVFYQIK